MLVRIPAFPQAQQVQQVIDVERQVQQVMHNWITDLNLYTNYGRQANAEEVAEINQRYGRHVQELRSERNDLTLWRIPALERG